MEKTLDSGKLVCSPDEPGRENVTKDVHKICLEGAMHAPPKEVEKFLKDATNNCMITDRVKWAKTHVNKEESTHDYNIVNDEESISVQSPEKSIDTCCIMCLACYKKSDYDELDKR